MTQSTRAGQRSQSLAMCRRFWLSLHQGPGAETLAGRGRRGRRDLPPPGPLRPQAQELPPWRRALPAPGLRCAHGCLRGRDRDRRRRLQ